MFKPSFIAALLLFSLLLAPALHAQHSPAASAHGKYSNLLQTLHCPTDRARYGDYQDYGRWGGGAWCGQTGKAGYWVWVDPNWYVWADRASAAPTPPPAAPALPARANANGKYSNLLQTIHCPADRSSYGDYRDYGRWGGGAWCGQTGKAGYWVWVDPNWYVWQNTAR